MSTTTTKTRRTASSLGLAVPASVVGAAGIAAVPALADTTRYDQAAFDTIVPSNFVILDSGNAFVLLTNGTALVLSPDQFIIDPSGNLNVSDAAAMAEIASAISDTAIPATDLNQVHATMAAYSDIANPYLHAGNPIEFYAASLRMQATLSDAETSPMGGADGAGAVAVVPVATLPITLLSFITFTGSSDDPAAPPILNPPPETLSGFVINGIGAGDESGFSVSSAGNINGDAYDDLIIGAYGANGNIGESYVIYGTDSYASTIALSSLSSGDGSAGFVITGIAADDDSGFSVSSAGDVNGDSIDDLVIGAPQGEGNDIGTEPGEGYVVFGKNASEDGNFSAVFNLSSLEGGDGSAGFVVKGIDAKDRTGFAVSSAGDINNDGTDDFIIGAWDASTMMNEGESYVVFGQNTAGDGNFPASLDLNSLNGTNGFTLYGDTMDLSGRAVSSAGDIDGDGIADLMIGTVLTNRTYVVFGRDGTTGETFDATFDLSGIDSKSGFVLNGISSGDMTGSALSLVGDVNGDGIGDIIIGAPGHDSNTGESYVIFGKNVIADGDFSTNFQLSSLETGDGSAGFVIRGIDGGDQSGWSVASAGDINGDGLNDILIGAPGHDGDTGESYVIFGKNVSEDGDFSATLELSSLETGDGSTGFVIRGIDAGDESGWSVASAGDINNDGHGDIVIGAPEANGSAGESYVIFGMPTFNAVVELDALPGLA